MAGVAGRARPGRATGRARVPRTAGRVDGRDPGDRARARPRGRRGRGTSTSAKLTPEDERRAGRVAGRPGRAEGRARREGRAARAARPRAGRWRGLTSDTALAAYLVRPGQRSFDLADLVLRYLRRELRAEEPTDAASCRLLDGEEEADATLAGATRSWRARAVAELADALDAELDQLGGTRLLAELELPLLAVLAELEAAGIAVDGDALAELEADFAAAGEAGRAGRVRGDRQGDQPRLAEAAAGGAVRRAGHAEDQAHQDRLHHRRGRAADLLRGDRAPVPRAPARSTGTPPGSRPPSTGCSSRSPTTAGSTPPTTRRSPRPGGCPPPSRTCRTSRSAPTRAAGSGRPSSSAPATSELMTADYSQIEMRIMAHLSEDAALIEAFRPGTTSTPPPRRGCSAVDAGRGHRRAAGQDQGDELRAGLRAVRVRAVRSSCGSPPRRPAS